MKIYLYYHERFGDIEHPKKLIRILFKIKGLFAAFRKPIEAGSPLIALLLDTNYKAKIFPKILYIILWKLYSILLEKIGVSVSMCFLILKGEVNFSLTTCLLGQRYNFFSKLLQGLIQARKLEKSRQAICFFYNPPKLFFLFKVVACNFLALRSGPNFFGGLLRTYDTLSFSVKRIPCM